MAKKLPTKAQLVAEARDLGVEVPPKATNPQIAALIAAKKAESGAGAPGFGSEAAEKAVVCPGFTGLNVRSGASMASPVVKVLEPGAKVAVETVEGGWAKVVGGWCRAEYLG